MKKLFTGFSFIAIAVFVACDGSGTNANSELLGNSSNSSSESFDEYDGEVEFFDDLPRCTGKKDGKVYYVEDEDIAYTCGYDEDEEAGEWVNASEGSDGSSASVPGGSSDASTYDVVTGTLTDSRDGQAYRTVKIGDQVWMAENLNYETLNSYCYDDDPANCAKYGRLYTWAAAVGKDEDECGYGYECGLGSGDIRGACPKGWHLPSTDEWNALFTAVGGYSTAGSKLKSQTGWTVYSGITNEDAFGFSALPAGGRLDTGSYDLEGSYAGFWSSSEGSSNYASCMYLYSEIGSARLGNDSKNYGFSVRCLKD